MVSGIDPELAERFLEEAYRAIELARIIPEQYSKIYRDYRRVLCERFPYRIIFEIVASAQAVHVLTVNHTSKHPDSWKARI